MTIDPVLQDASRRAVLTAWGEQERPMVLAQQYQHAMYWLTQNDEYLTKQQGSYRAMIATPPLVHRLRGWRGMLVVIRADRTPPPPRWHEALYLVSHLPGVSIWTEVLP